MNFLLRRELQTSMRFDYDTGLTTAGRCANHPDRPAVSYVSGQGFCQDCLGRNSAQQFRPPQSNVGTPPFERSARSRQEQADFIAAVVAQALPKSTPDQRSTVEAAVRRRVSLAGSESAFLAALGDCQSKADLDRLLHLVDEHNEPVAKPKQVKASEPPKTTLTQTVVANSGVPCESPMCENVAVYVSGKPLIAGKSLCIEHAFADDPQAVLALTEQQREYFGQVGAGRVSPDQLESERRRRMGRGQPRRPGAFKYHKSKPATNAEYQRAHRAKVKRPLVESKKQPEK